MRDQTVSPNGIHLAGTFNDWSTTSTLMTTTEGSDIYTITLPLITDSAYYYRFVNGNSSNDYETVPAECGTQANGAYSRTILNNGNDSTLLDVCFSSCNVCPLMPVVTFQVDMRDQTVDPGGVHLAGSFNNWSTTATPMTLISSTVYAVELTLAANETYTYKFVNGNTETGNEIVPTECGVQSGNVYNRFVELNEDNILLPVVCFSSCSACPTQAQITFRVDMNLETIDPSGVHLAGSFNNWSTTATPMTLISSTMYAVELTLAANETYTYKFVNGNTETGNEIVPAECGVQSGNVYNRFVQVNEDNIVLPVVCFSYCNACPAESQITFRVDMNLETIDPDGVHIAGNFNNWSTSANPMNNLGAGIYGVTIPSIFGNEIEYRFVNGNTSDGFETVPGECGVPDGNEIYNRFLSTPENDSTLSIVCFSRCTLCPPTHEVTFSVDMSQQTVSPDGVHLAGSFNDFDPASLLMLNQGNSVYVVTIELIEDEFITYRFVNGADASGFETVPVSCGTNDGSGTYNRSFTVVDNNTTLDQVCFGECEDCVQPPGQTDVTFIVDMNLESVSTDGVFLAGTFNNWSTTANQMNHIGDNIYSITLTLSEGDVHQYRFVNGNSSEGYETVPASCGFSGTSGGLERRIIVPVDDTTLMNVCFSSCSNCISYQLTVSVDMMNEVIDPAGVHLAGNFNNWNPNATEMVSVGSTVYEAVIQVYEGDSLIYRFVNGNESVNMETVPLECGWLYNGTDYARIVIPAMDMEVDTVCFSRCIGCIVGLEEITQSVIFGDMFPNPSAISVTFPITIHETVDVTFVVIDILGNPLQTNFYTLSEGYQEVKLDVQNLSGGVYFIQYLIKGDQTFEQSTCKLLISR
jgi:1,4-alpha-glucan branching enzyme